MALLATAIAIGGEFLFDFLFDAGVAIAVEGAEGIAASLVEPAAATVAEALVTTEEALPVATETLKEAFGQAFPQFAKQTTIGVADQIKNGVKRKNTRSQKQSQDDLPSSFDLEQVHPDEVLDQLNDDQLDFLEDEDDFVHASPMPNLKTTKRKQTPAAAAAIQRERESIRDRSPVAGPSRQLTPPPSARKSQQQAEQTPLPDVDSDEEISSLSRVFESYTVPDRDAPEVQGFRFPVRLILQAVHLGLPKPSVCRTKLSVGSILN
ncbi:hypothetical protein RRG08_007582 [Elysia crispata]|uniref:Uncharacterized protein n=1 Tax=Elysia crispata TaxID=231223 RepID=A0AAE0Z6J0_9GAST|nr:hypothetical protein RRG08_007582 [Elysia crispata]